DRLQRRPDEGVAMGLAAGEGAGIAAEKGKMRREFLAKRHVNATPSIVTGLLGGRLRDCNPVTVAQRCASNGEIWPGPVLARGWNNRRSFLFPTPRGPIIRCRRTFASVSAGT